MTVDTGTTDPEDTTAKTTDAPEDQGGDANGEAAKYRHKLRDTEAERDTVSGQLGAQRTAVLHALAKAGGVTPQLLAAAEVKAEDLLDDDGLLDQEQAAEAIERVRLGNNLPRRPRVNGVQGGSHEGADSSSSSWGTVLGGNVRTQR